MRHKLLLVFMLQLVFSSSVYARQDWTTFRAADDGKYITAVEAEGDTIWYGSRTGVVCFNKIDGSFTRFTTENGLIDNTVNDIATDYNGVKWIATESGVSQFDGTTWTSFSSGEYFYGKKIHSITIDNNNVKWFAARTVIASYDGQKWQLFREPHNEKGMNLISVCSDKSGVLWCGSEHKGVASFDGYEWKYYDNFQDLYNLKFVTIDVDENDVKWFGIFDGRLISYNGNEWTVQRVVESPSPRLYNLVVEKSNGLWAATNQGLHHINNGIVTVFEHNDAIFNSSLRSLTFDTEEMLWIGGYLGISKFDGSHFSKSTLLRGPLRDTIVSIAFGPDNVKWFGHAGIGVSRFDGTFWSAHIHDFQYIGQEIAVDKYNDVWVTAGWDGVICFDGISSRQYNLNSGATRTWVLYKEIFIDGENRVWVTSDTRCVEFVCYGSTSYIHEGKRKFYEIFDDLTMDSEHTIYGTNSSGIYRFSENEFVLYINRVKDINANPIEYEYKYINNFLIDKNDIILGINSDGGIFTTSDGTLWNYYNKENSFLTSNNVLSIVTDHNNTKWIGTDAGVCRFDGETWTTFNTKNSGLCDNKVNAIAVEKNNTIWFGTDNGVSRYTGEIITTSVDEEDEIPEELPIIHSYPNPFNPSTTIEFTLPESGFITLSIYNISGQKVRELAAEYMTAGMHNLIWDGRDDSGDAVSSGIYITRLVAGKQIAAGRMVFLK